MSDTNTQQTTDTTQASQPETSQGSTEGTQEALFTQSHVDTIATRARKEAREIERKKVLEDLGIENFDSLKSLLKEHQDRKQAEMSELEKAQAQIDAANRKAQDAEKRIQEMETRILNDARRNVFETAVTTNGGTNAKRLYMLVQAEKPTEFTALFGDDATPDDSKLKAFIKQVQADFPEYFGTQGAGSPSASGGIAPTSLQRATEDAKKEIEKLHGKL